MKLKSNPENREVISNEWSKMFQETRNELRRRAKNNILKIQQENRSSFNRHRKEARRYKEEDLVAIKRTQSGPGLKFAHKYEIILRALDSFKVKIGLVIANGRHFENISS
ncbi:hypothetical protein WN55_02632 [Dufourea novaeangliae]|uniref:Uncharacterized protein n=1 Tax=Dufourea novaeangliae TaxID=178035 RepID=A0A154PJK2_DUFNO|nr:hypothetical protein WN55_02632 [Dufourea novaeangliae]